MKNKNAHVFSGKIIYMLLACDTILVSAIRYQADFLARRTTFIPSYFTDLQTRIDQGYMMVGADKLREQRQGTILSFAEFSEDVLQLLSFLLFVVSGLTSFIGINSCCGIMMCQKIHTFHTVTNECNENSSIENS